MDAVSKLFVTHLHSDHLVDLPAFVLMPWAAPSARDVPLEVWGPGGTRDMVRHLELAFSFDIHIRRDVDERASATGIEVIARDVREGTVYNQGGVKITRSSSITARSSRPSRLSRRSRRTIGRDLGRHLPERQPRQLRQGQAADIVRRVSPRLAVFSRADGGAAVAERTRKTYPGRVEFGEDLMVIEIDDEVVLRRRGADAPR